VIHAGRERGLGRLRFNSQAGDHSIDGLVSRLVIELGGDFGGSRNTSRKITAVEPKYE
jgi:hypothetical protein